MKSLAVAVALLTLTGISTAEAQSRPGGCLKYGLGGAIAGHFAGGHRLKGALAGCAIGMMERRRHEQAMRERREQNRTTDRRQPQPRRAPSESSPYEDLGLDRTRPGPGEVSRAPAPRPRQEARQREAPAPRQQPRQAPRQEPRPEGFEHGGSFSRRQPGSDPDITGGIWPNSGTVY